MNPAYVQIVIMLGGMAAQGIFTIWFFRWKKRENIPETLERDLKDLAKQIVVIRGQIKYIEGRLNGKMWKGEH